MLSNQISISEYKKQIKKNRTHNKYRNDRKAKFKGERFDSKLERDFGYTLELMKANGEIKDYSRQITIDFYGLISNDDPETILIQKYERPHEPIKDFKQGKFMKIVSYRMDFKVIHNDDSIEYYEVKGFQTDLWKVKWNLLSLFSDVKLTIINQVKFGRQNK